METLYKAKDQVVGGVKSAFGAITGNEESQKEAEQQKQQAEDSSAKSNPQDETTRELPAELNAEMHMKKGKVFEEMGSKTDSKEMTNQGKQMQKEARDVKEWQGTQDTVAGRTKEVPEVPAQEKEKDEDTKKKNVEEEIDSTQQTSIMEDIYTVKDILVGGAKSAIGSLIGNEDLKNEGERQRDPTHDSADSNREDTTKEKFAQETKSQDTKKEAEEEEDRDSSQHSSVKETLSSVKDKVVGGTKSAVGAMTGNEEWQKEGEQQQQQQQQQQQAKDFSSLTRGEVNAEMHMKRGKVFEEMGSKTDSKEMINEGKQMQKEASAVKEWQDTQDIIAGRTKKKFAPLTDNDEKKEEDFGRKSGEGTKSDWRGEIKGGLLDIFDALSGQDSRSEEEKRQSDQQRIREEEEEKTEATK